MRVLRELFANEAAVAVSILEAVLAVAVAFGFDLTGEQVAALVALLVPIGGLVTRMSVWADASVQRERNRAYADGVAAQPHLGPDGPE